MLLFSCQSEFFHDYVSKVPSRASRHGYHVTEDEAVAISLEFIGEMNQKTRSGGTKEVVSVIPWRFDDMLPQSRNNADYEGLPDTMLYIVNFKNNGGFVLVPADTRIKGILAYVEEGNLSPSDNIDNEGFKLFLSRLPDYYMREFDGPSFGFDTIPPTPGLLDPWVVDSLVGPLLTTAWHQFSPFNDSCPTWSGGHAYAGCLAIATAQVLARFRQPTTLYGHTYDWDEIMTGPEPQSNAGKASVAQFVHDIGQYIGTDYNYNDSGFSRAIFTDAYYYLDNLGFDCFPQASYSLPSYDFDLCMQSFNDGCPVLICGNDSLKFNAGHAWVLDGGAIRENVRVFNNTPIYQYLIHCNWGWNHTPSSNGYFESGVFDNYLKIADTLTRSSDKPRHAYWELYIYHHIQPKQK